MAITYKKVLKSIVITTVGGNTVSVADTADAPIASNALAEFEAYKTMHIVTDENEKTYIPFHAVDNIVVTASQSDDITKADPYCEEESSSDADDSNEGQG